jgi:hypothetical protein
MGINIDELLLAGPRGRKLLVSVHRNCGPDGCISLPDPGPRQGRGLVMLLPVAMVMLFTWRPFGQLLRCAVLAAIRLACWPRVDIRIVQSDISIPVVFWLMTTSAAGQHPLWYTKGHELELENFAKMRRRHSGRFVLCLSMAIFDDDVPRTRAIILLDGQVIVGSTESLKLGQHPPLLKHESGLPHTCLVCHLPRQYPLELGRRLMPPSSLTECASSCDKRWQRTQGVLFIGA